mmetsp:Transcript_141347/g.368024  ORF Transcript_141347/g.368024 Transcript_141347/m.368024 type:complete len:101 (-) Transcript_141347:20-322(-)
MCRWRALTRRSIARAYVHSPIDMLMHESWRGYVDSADPTARGEMPGAGLILFSSVAPREFLLILFEQAPTIDSSLVCGKMSIACIFQRCDMLLRPGRHRA